VRTRVLVALAAVLLGGSGAGAALVRGDGPLLPGRAAAPSVPPEPSRPPLLPSPGQVPVPTSAGLSAVLSQALADPALGGAVAASVVDARTGTPLLDVRGATPVVPASTAKIATAVAVLSGLPPDTRLSTRVLAGPQPGDVVLVGGGDVTLAGPTAMPGSPPPARLADLAARARSGLAGAPVNRVLVDDTAYLGTTGPGWRPGYVAGGDVAPVSALSVDGGRAVPGHDGRVADPALAAGKAFAALLGAPAAPVLRGTAAPGALPLGAVDSPPVPLLVEQMLTRSDNDLAETLAHRLALAQGRPGTFEGAAEAVRATLAEVVPEGGIALVDGSGLSRDNRVQPAALAGLLSRVARETGDGRLSPVLSGLPVAGFDGTLEGRYRTGPSLPAAGDVRAKTGTLEGVSALAGLVRTADGGLLAFDVTAGAVPVGATRAAEAALDRVAAALASCGCR